MPNIVTTIDKAEQVKFINELKELRKIKKMTYEQIVDTTDKNGQRVSLGTVKNVFRDNTEYNHDYNNTLVPIFNALCPPSEDDDIVVKTLRTKLEIRKEAIEQLKSNIKQLESQIQIQEQKYDERESYLKSIIDDLREEIKFKNEQIRHHNGAMDRKDAFIKELIQNQK